MCFDCYGGPASQQSLPPGPLTPNQNSQSQQQVVQVIFHGDVYGAGGMTEIIRRINSEVVNNRQMLVASHTITGTSIR